MTAKKREFVTLSNISTVCQGTVSTVPYAKQNHYGFSR